MKNNERHPRQAPDYINPQILHPNTLSWLDIESHFKRDIRNMISVEFHQTNKSKKKTFSDNVSL